MTEAGTKMAFHNVFKSGKVYCDSLEKRINKRLKELESKVMEMRNLYETICCLTTHRLFWMRNGTTECRGVDRGVRPGLYEPGHVDL